MHLPVAGSARPVEDSQRVSEDRLVLNVDKDGHLLVGGQAQPLNEAIQTIKHQADLVKLNLKAAGLKYRSGQGPAHDDRLPGRQGLDLRLRHEPDQCVPDPGIPQVRLKAMTSSDGVASGSVASCFSGRRAAAGLSLTWAEVASAASDDCTALDQCQAMTALIAGNLQLTTDHWPLHD